MTLSEAAAPARGPVHLDYDASDWPEPCLTCEEWAAAWVDDEDGRPVLREWHAAACTTYLTWL